MTEPDQIPTSTAASPPADASAMAAMPSFGTSRRLPIKHMPAAPPPTKGGLLRERIASPGGAPLVELIAATGWQAHRVRAAISGLRQRGLVVVCHREGDDRIYRLASLPTGVVPVGAAHEIAEACAAGRAAALPPEVST